MRKHNRQAPNGQADTKFYPLILTLSLKKSLQISLHYLQILGHYSFDDDLERKLNSMKLTNAVDGIAVR